MLLTAALALVGARPTLEDAPYTPLSIEDLHNNYGNIFPTNNRNAASHLWSSWILQRASTLRKEDLSSLFSGFCPVSGSPVTPFEGNKYHYRLQALAGGEAVVGFVHHCCAPCVCDTLDLIKADTKTISLVRGVQHQFTFAVIGDPCAYPEKLSADFSDPFSGQTSTLNAVAPEVSCEGGKLRGATYSDNGGVIIGLLEQPAPPLGPAADPPNPNHAVTVAGHTFKDTRDFRGFCEERAASGYASGMGLIFRLVAQINVLKTSAAVVAAPSPGKCDGILPASRDRMRLQPSAVNGALV